MEYMQDGLFKNPLRFSSCYSKPVILRYFVSWGEILAMSSDALSVWNLQNQTLDHEYIKCLHLQRLIHNFSAVIVSVWSIMF